MQEILLHHNKGGGMSEFNLNEMSLRDLQDLKKKVDAAVASYEARKLQEARAELDARAKELGFSLAELVASSTDAKPKKTRKPSTPKWRHRENHEMTWTGQGKRPKWFEHAELIPTQE